ncbi:MAG TPA: sel1 repeat family protein [Rhodospirillaceae bacterium]|nr:sel1 repeat family protein [Rhodospirillaceae bacterium]
MKNPLLLLSTTALIYGFCLSPLWAQFDDGVAALQREDYAKALEIWQRGAADGDPKSQYSLGYLYQFGLGTGADFGKAKEWYEKSAASNNPDALYALGIMYESGKAGRKDLAEAMRLYRQAAQAGSQPDAEYAIGRMILRGRGVARDPVEGVKWLTTAARHNQPAAQYMLGAAFEAGWGMPPNDREAYYWYRRSQNGDAVELQENDMAFQPQIAIAALKRRLPAEAIDAIEGRLRSEKSTPVKAAAPAATAKAATPSVKSDLLREPGEEGAPPALTRPQ